MGEGLPGPRERSGGLRCCTLVAAAIGLCVAVLAVGALTYYRRFAAKARIEYTDMMAAIRAAEEPVTADEVAPQAVPDGENAALLLEDAFDLVIEPEGGDPLHDIYSKTSFADDSTAEERERMYRGLLRPNREVLEKVREALKRPECRFDLDYSDGLEVELPHLASMRQIARLLDMSAYRELDAGRPDNALAELRNGLKLGRCLEKEPILISQLVRMAAHGITCNRLAPVIASGKASEEALDRTAKLLGECTDRAAFVEAMKGERAFGGSVDLGQDVRLQGLIDKNRAVYLRYMTELIAVAQEPHWISAPKLDTLAREIEAQCGRGGYLDRASHWLTALLVPALGRASEQDARCEALLTVIRLGCLVELHRKRTGALPSMLDDLVPGLIDRIPPDPFTGKPYRYRVGADGRSYTVYSVGSNGTDDGGTWDPSGGGRQAWEEGDIVFEGPLPAAPAEPETGN